MSKKISLLLIEDDQLARKIETLILNQLNCEITAAATRQVAMGFLQNQCFDIIFADLSLPDSDGFSLLNEIRMSPSANQQVPIIVLSAYSDEETIQQALAAGASDFLVKPMNKDNGRHVLMKYLNNNLFFEDLCI